MTVHILATFALAISQPVSSSDVATPQSDQPAAVPVEVEFTIKEKKKITDKKHPDYVRCRSKPVIGSLAKKRRVCMTNKEWVAANSESSKQSKEFIEDMGVGMNNNGL